ncbi:6-hydroxymethylpterin diphosphokinase MptE-like protein [Pseudobacillus sp. FSL P4-0506]|uniref:motility associated factor glycosyltransferase family protein n=1 Tax=Pseudobacillus sp. FSL P4-0506 TaxID=2921576 RepID=UPI0030F9EB9F
MLADNQSFVQKFIPNFLDQSAIDLKDHIEVENSRAGFPTIKVRRDEKEFYLHSKYNPLEEAERIIQKYSEKIEKSNHVLFYGIGMGFHIDLFIRKFPDKAFTLYESQPQVLKSLLEERNISHWSEGRLQEFFVEFSMEKQNSFIYRFLEKINDEVTLIVLPAHERLFKEEYKMFSSKLSEGIKNWKNHLHVNLAFQKRWVLNGLKNFSRVLVTPNFLHDVKKEWLKERPAIIVSAGPSLSDDLEEIKHIKDNRLAYIFAVGSAVNGLIEYGIYPDAAFTYDPKEENYKVFEKIVAANLSSIPLIFGSSVGHETLQSYPGEMLHFITSQDSIGARYLVREDDENIISINDSPSIAVITFQILSNLGCNPIILSGQNLAYRDKKWYAKEVMNLEVSEEANKEAILVESVEGKMVETNEDFNRMRLALESYIEKNPSIQVINTTVQGAAIKRTRFMEIKEVINQYLTEYLPVSFDEIIRNAQAGYDIDKVTEDFNNQKNREDLKEAYRQAKRILDKLQYELKVTRNFGKVQQQYIKFINHLKKILDNECFIVFIMPIMQIQFNLFVQGLNDLHLRKNIIEEIETSLPFYIKFLEGIKSSMDVILPVYQEVSQELASAQIK